MVGVRVGVCFCGVDLCGLFWSLGLATALGDRSTGPGNGLPMRPTALFHESRHPSIRQVCHVMHVMSQVLYHIILGI